MSLLMAMEELQKEKQTIKFCIDFGRHKRTRKLNTYEYKRCLALYFYHRMYLVVVVAMDELNLPAYKKSDLFCSNEMHARGESHNVIFTGAIC